MSENLFDDLCKMPRPHKVVDFPRKNEQGEPVGQVAIWVLTQVEQEESIANADKRARSLMKADKGDVPKEDEAKVGYKDLYTNAVADEILYRACRKVGRVTESLFPSPMHMRQRLSVDEVGLLMTNYWTVQDELGPIASRLTTEQEAALIERIRKTGERSFLDFLSPDGARNLVFSMARQPLSFWTDICSPGQPPDAGTSSSSSPNDAPDLVADR